MKGSAVSLDDIAALAVLANGIIPPDATDAGAAVVHAGAGLGEKIRNGPNASLYYQGLEAAANTAQQHFQRPITQLTLAEIHTLLGELQQSAPAFFKQLRMDVCALYLSDPGVWQRIGFPGPSTSTGGYTDFDQPQTFPLIFP